MKRFRQESRDHIVELTVRDRIVIADAGDQAAAALRQ